MTQQDSQRFLLRQRPKIFIFCFKSSDTIFFLLSLSPIVNKFQLLKYCLINLEIVKRLKNYIIMLKTYLKQDNVVNTQHYLV